MTEDPKIVRLDFVEGAVKAAEEAPPAEPEDKGRAGKPRGDSALPHGCPVIALGVKGDYLFFLDAIHQLREYHYSKMTRLGLDSLFGNDTDLLADYWPRLSKPDKEGKQYTTGWRPELAAEALMKAAAAAGVYDPFKFVRGPGAWTDEDGDLILHQGNKILVFSGPDPWGTKTAHQPGKIGDYVYPAYEVVPGPSSQPAAADGGPAAELLTLFNTWSWRRADLDALLLVGWTGCALIGGALPWRPLAWITGGKGTGKSTLHRVLDLVFGGALVSVSDASAAGIWQELKYATLPVALDEMEATEDNRQVDRVIQLARMAASGGLILRGGADHSSSKFHARSCFLFSSILVPPLEAADRSRMAILELGELGQQPAPKIEAKQLKALGAGLRRRLVDGWHRFPETNARYRFALTAEGLSARAADQFGTMLAVADVLLHDEETDSDTAAEWAVKVAAGVGGEFDRAEGLDEFLMVNHLMGSAVELPHKAGRAVIGELVRKALLDDDGDTSNHTLGTFGLSVMWESDGKYLAIAFRNPELSRLFRGTHWGGRASRSNVWVQAARRLPGAKDRKTTYFPGCNARAVLVPIGVFVGPEVEQKSEDRSQPAHRSPKGEGGKSEGGEDVEGV